MKFSKHFTRRALAAIFLSASVSSTLMMGGTSQAQQGVSPQQVLEQTLVRQQQDLEALLKQHEAQRQVLNNAIQVAASATPVNNQAIHSLQRQLNTLQQKQDADKQALAIRQRQESDALRAGVNQPAGGQNPTAPQAPAGPQDPATEVPEISPTEVADMALDATSLPTPVVVDRAFNELGTVNDLVFQDKAAAIQLGKALFWDVQVGSDNKTACATCHNFGGADWRNRNQLASGGNKEITLGDFMKNPEGRLDGILGSQGVTQNHYVGVNPPGADLGNPPSAAELAEQFTLNGTVESRTRQVTGRNTPSVINAAFYSRQFWDGRASRYFNGENIFGASDPNAGVWENHGGSLTKNNDFLVDYGSLASQAVGPPGSSVEMAHGPDGARDFHEIGMKLLDSSVRPLGLQKVHANDSVLSTLVAADGVGLQTTYADLVRQAFKPVYWNFEGGDVNGYTQMEANFGMFFGLAIQEYERTLISDQSRFDEFAKGDQDALSFDEKKGLNLFMSGGTACTACHSGGVFSEARWDVTLADPIENSGSDVIETAWANIGVSDQNADLGVGRMDLPFGPISLAKLAAGETNNKTVVPGAQQWPGLPSAEGLPVLVDGAFKIPTLRNVELTAPYFHTGGYSTLEDVVKFYSRGGDFPENPHLDGDIHPIGELEGKPEKIAQIAAFLRSLTDDRVRHRSAPFDHPELPVPNGHNPGPSGVALDNIVVLAATGAEGTASVFPMFSDRIGATDPKSGVLDFVAEAGGQGQTGPAADQAAIAADAQRNQLNLQMNQAQDQLNAETRAVNAQVAAGAITPAQQDAMLADINARRNALVQQINNQMAQIDVAPATGGTTAGGGAAGGGAAGGGAAGGGAAAGGAAAGGVVAPEIPPGADVTIAGGFTGTYVFEGPVTAATSTSVTVMGIVTVDMSQHLDIPITGTLIGNHDNNAATPDAPLTWRQLGVALGGNYSDLANHPLLKGYVLKGSVDGTAGNPVVRPTVLAGVTPAAFADFTLAPRENVAIGNMIDLTPNDLTDSSFECGGVRVEATNTNYRFATGANGRFFPATGFPTVTRNQLQAACGTSTTVIGYWVQEANRLFVSELIPDVPAVVNAPGIALGGVEGPISAVDPLGAYIEVMGHRINIASTLEIPGATPVTGTTFLGRDIPRLLDANRTGVKKSIIGATLSADYTMANGVDTNAAAPGTAFRVNFIELAENVLVIPLAVENPINPGIEARMFPFIGNATVPNGLVPSLDTRFAGTWTDIGGEPIVIRNVATDGSTRAANRSFVAATGTTPQKEVVTVNSANGMLYSIIGYYADSDGKFYVVDGASEYHPAGTVRIQQAKARQRDGQFTMDIRGQVKPEGGDAIPANAVIDAGAAGIFTVPTTAAIGFVPVGGTPPAGADIGRFRLNLRTGNETAATIAPESVTGAATSLTRNAILAHTRVSDIRDVRIPANIPVAPDAGAAAPATAVASLLQTANGTTNLAPGVTGTVGVLLAKQRVDLAITAPGALFAADFRALLAANPVLGLAIDPATIVATATNAAGVVTTLNPAFVAFPDPAVAGGVLLEGGFRGQTALDLAGSTISVKLVNGTQQATVISGAFSTGLTFSNTSPGTVPTPVVPANAVVIGRDPGAGVPVEGFAAQVTGNVTIANRVANQSRLDITIANVPVSEFVNRTGLLANGVVPANLDVAASGLTAEFLDANGNILAVSPYFTGAFQNTSLVTLSLSARDANLATVLRTATQVRIVQSIAQGNTFGTLDLVTMPITDNATAEINLLQVNQVAGLP